MMTINNDEDFDTSFVFDIPGIREKVTDVGRDWHLKSGGNLNLQDPESRYVLKEVMKDHSVDPGVVFGSRALQEVSLVGGGAKQKYQTDRGGTPTDFFYIRDSFEVSEAGLMLAGGEDTVADLPENPVHMVSDGGSKDVDSNMYPEAELYAVWDMHGGIVSGDKAESSYSPQYIEDNNGRLYQLRFSSLSQVHGTFIASNPSGGSGMTWNTAAYETAACMGVVAFNDGNNGRYLGDLVVSDAESGGGQEFLAEVSGLLNASGYDYDSKGLEKISTAVSKALEGEEDAFSAQDAGTLATLADGVIEFCNSVFGSNSSLSFIHGRIDDYYKAEIDNEQVGTDPNSGKANTADFVIIEGSPDDIFTAYSNDEPVAFGPDGPGEGICEVSDTRFVQVSHKKAFGNNSQLGRILTSLRDMYDLADNDDFNQFAAQAANEHSKLDEGFLDAVKSAASDAMSAATTGFEFVVNKVKGGVKAVVTKFLSWFNKVVEKLSSVVSGFKSKINDTKDLESVLEADFDIIADKINLDLVEDIDVSSWNKDKKARAIVEAWNGSPSQKPKMLYKELNDLLSRVRSLVDNNPNIGSLSPTGQGGTVTAHKDSGGIPSEGKPLQPTTNTLEEGMNELTRIWATYQSLHAILAVLGTEAGKVKDVGDTLEEFIGLQKEMVFGRTQLPVWKVSATDFKLLSDGESFKQDLRDEIGVDEIMSSDQSSFVILVQVSPKANGSTSIPGNYATTTVYVADGSKMVSDNRLELTYTKLEFRSEGHLLSFAATGKQGGIEFNDLAQAVA